MIVILPLLVSGTALVFAYYHLFRRSKSFISKLPGPPSPSILFGNFIEILHSETGLIHKKWFDAYGPVIRDHTLYGEPRLATIDPKAINYMLLKNSYDYPKPHNLRADMKRFMGEGVVSAEGLLNFDCEAHKRQRRLLNPTFSPGQLRALTPLVFQIASQLGSMWSDLTARCGEEEYVLIDTLPWFNRAALDIIGLAGFDYKFESLEKEGKNELANSFYAVMRSNLQFLKMGGLKFLMLDTLRKIPLVPSLFHGERSRKIEHSLNIMQSESKKALVRAQKSSEHQGTSKDFLSLLIRAINAEKGTRDEMSDEEVMGQMTTFIFAGHETTATGLAWQLWILAKHPKVQENLRKELLQAAGHQDVSAAAEGIPISMDELQALPYLDAFVRETLRLFPPVTNTTRVAARDDQIPLSKPVRMGTGEVVDHLPIRAGEQIFLPIYAFNRSKDLFGENADEFQPERWLQGEVNNTGTGLWAGLLTFLTGPRSCIGYRFALLEMKAILFVLLTKFKFKERDEGGGPDFERRGVMLMKPKPKGENGTGSMPLRVSPI